MTHNHTTRSAARRSRGQRGQTLLIFGLMFVFLMGIVGLATDSAFAYFRSISIERAAAAAALAGVPYMPRNFASGAPGRQDAWDRAVDEATRNGFPPGSGVTIVPAKTTQDRELAVTITAPSPTFFMSALGFPTFKITRTAVAGYKPPIALGQPGPQIGATVSKLGTGEAFYFARYKGWNNLRSEGDPFTPNPDELVTGGTPGAKKSGDVHQFSQLNGVEAPQLDCSAGAYKMPCRGGYNWRIVIPNNQAALVEVYNAADAPDLGATRGNKCENERFLPTCNTSGYHYHEDDIGTGNHCNPLCTDPQKNAYNATAYTLLDVPNVFLRSQDKVLSQTTVSPIDATNYDGDQGNTGGGSIKPPSYINVRDSLPINQYYDASGAPCNMKIYHAWMDAANYDGSRVGACTAGDNVLLNDVVKRVPGACGTPCVYNSPKPALVSPSGSGLGPGTYRLRVDALNFDGSFSTSLASPIGGNSSKGYSIRVVGARDGKTDSCVGCTVSGWQDMCVYTPLNAGTGIVPLFELTPDYAGATIDVDVFDLGDSRGNVNLGIIDPSTGVLASLGTPITGTGITNMGITRLNPGTAHTIPQSPVPKPVGDIIPSTAGSAEYEAASSAYGPEYQGSWIRISIPIPPNYSPPAYPNDFWMLQYTNTGGANDTFAFTVSARGGPVHLLRS